MKCAPLIILIFFSSILAAQIPVAANNIEKPCDFWCQVAKDYKSPVTTSANNYLLAGTVLTGTVLIFEDQIVDPTQAEITEDKPLGKYSKIGDYSGQLIPNFLYIVGMAGASWSTSNPEYANDSILMFKSSLYAVATSTLLKGIVREPRPNNSDDRNSFPSGHSTSAFAFASTVGALHGWRWGVPAYALAGLVAFSRINDNKHYLHDVIAGATIGTAYGIGLTEVYKAEKNSEVKTSFQLFPIDSTGGVMASLKYEF